VRALRAALPDDVVAHVHAGATSQDVIDTAAMLVARRAIAVILADRRRRARCGHAAGRRAP
jgi:3-carboxy-cis,cis-muconate cycloisomerase